jgi:hypothetical protein
LVVDFINETDLDTLQDKANVIDSFLLYAQSKQKAEALELITEENLNEEEAKRYITTSLKREYASENGTELNALLPKMSPLNPQYLTKKQSVFQKLVSFVEKFKGVSLFLDEEVKELVGDKMSKLELFENKRIYTDFGTPKENSFQITIDIEKHPKFSIALF